MSSTTEAQRHGERPNQPDRPEAEVSPPCLRVSVVFAFVCVLCGEALGQSIVLEFNELELMLQRAASGRVPTARERHLAAELLKEWRESEEVSPVPGDPGIGRALRAMASGTAPARRDGPALVRLVESARIDRAVGGTNGDAAGAPEGAGTAGGGRPGGSRGLWAPIVAGAAVLAGGLVWILAARALKTSARRKPVMGGGRRPAERG